MGMLVLSLNCLYHNVHGLQCACCGRALHAGAVAASIRDEHVTETLQEKGWSEVVCGCVAYSFVDECCNYHQNEHHSCKRQHDNHIDCHKHPACTMRGVLLEVVGEEWEGRYAVDIAFG